MAKIRRLNLSRDGYSCVMSGVWQAVAHNEGAAVIFHSPRACAHIGKEMELSASYRMLARGQQEIFDQAPLVASGLTEAHSIFGGGEQLLQCIRYVEERFCPHYILVTNSCVAGIIGDDTEAIVKQAAAELAVPVMAVPGHGFLDGDFYSGFYETANLLVERLMAPLPRLADTAVLLGDRGGPESEDVREIERLLRDFGLTVLGHFPSYASLASIRQLPAAALAVPLAGRGMNYPWLQKLGEKLRQNFGIDFFDQPYPVGWLATRDWLDKLGGQLNRRCEAAIAIGRQAERLARDTADYRRVLQQTPAVLCIGRPLAYFDPAWVFEFLELGGVRPAAVLLLDDLTDAEKQAMRQQLQTHTAAPVLEMADGEAALAAAELVITTHELADGGKRQLFLPLLPPAGVGGIVAFLQKMARLAMRQGSRGGIVYGW
ncbi:MAG: nitrogenase component 1 [Sporomusaceae bacterium]|nr:nitrogenase component 1 [Sporomusaceae bacterium]